LGGPASVKVQQHVAPEDAGRAQRMPATQEFRAAHWEQRLSAQARDLQPWPASVAVADRDVYVLAREVDVVERRADAQVDARMGLGEAAEAVHQPLGGEVRRRGHGQHAGALSLQQAFGPGGEAVEGVAHHLEIRAPRLGDDQPLALTVEEAKAEFGLEAFTWWLTAPCVTHSSFASRVKLS
jgi:hypothetical protein